MDYLELHSWVTQLETYISQFLLCNNPPNPTFRNIYFSHSKVCKSAYSGSASDVSRFRSAPPLDWRLFGTNSSYSDDKRAKEQAQPRKQPHLTSSKSPSGAQVKGGGRAYTPPAVGSTAKSQVKKIEDVFTPDREAIISSNLRQKQSKTAVEGRARLTSFQKDWHPVADQMWKMASEEQYSLPWVTHPELV